MSTVISANRLDDGTVAFLDANGDWVDSIAEARVFATKMDETAALEAASRAVARNLVLDPIIVEILDTPAGRRAVSLRDRIRAAGPTIKYAAGPNISRSRHVPL